MRDSYLALTLPPIRILRACGNGCKKRFSHQHDIPILIDDFRELKKIPANTGDNSTVLTGSRLETSIDGASWDAPYEATVDIEF